MIFSMVVVTMTVILAGLAGEFHFSFQRHAMESLSLAAQAIALREKGVQEEAESVLQQGSATKDFAVAETDEASSQQLQYASARDREVASAEMTRSSEFQAQAVVEEETASVHAAAGTAAQNVAAESMEAAGTDEVTAARWEAAAAEDGWTVTVCQMIPLLDVACDVIGGTTLLLAEAAGTESTAKAAVEWTAAVTATREREREETLAAEYEQQAVQQQEEAVLTKENANAARMKAEEEAAEAEALEMQSQEAKEKAVAEGARAQELSAAAATEESTSFELGQQSIVVGVQACWDGIVKIIMATGAMVLVAVRIVNSCQFVPSMCSARTTSTSKRFDYKQETRSFLPSLLRNMSFLWHYAGLFVLSVNLNMIVKPWMQEFSKLDCRHRGEAILRFALVAAMLQTLALHTVPYTIQAWYRHKNYHRSKLVLCIDVCVRVAIYIFLLTSWLVLEFLILWAVWGPSFLKYLLFSTYHLDWLVSPISIGLGITVILHCCFLEIYVPSPLCYNRIVDENQTAQVDDEDIEGKSEWEPITETSSLLPSDRPEVSSHDKCLCMQPVFAQHLQLLVASLKVLQYPLELLVCACMISVLQKCKCLMNWPVSKSLLLTHAPRWVRPAAIVLVTLAFSTFFVMIVRRFWQCCKLQHLSRKSDTIQSLNVS
jgi:hypothetical protein